MHSWAQQSLFDLTKVGHDVNADVTDYAISLLGRLVSKLLKASEHIRSSHQELERGTETGTMAAFPWRIFSIEQTMGGYSLSGPTSPTEIRKQKKERGREREGGGREREKL